jgi:hypothetical protein
VTATNLSTAEAALSTASSLTARSLLFGSGPRFAGDAFGPVLAFYVGWKLAGTSVGVGLATAVGVLAWYAERRRERPGAVAMLSLGFVFVQAGVGLAFGSARVYLAQQVFLSAGLGVAFLVSVVVGRPLAGLFAQDIFSSLTRCEGQIPSVGSSAGSRWRGASARCCEARSGSARSARR